MGNTQLAFMNIPLTCILLLILIYKIDAQNYNIRNQSAIDDISGFRDEFGDWDKFLNQQWFKGRYQTFIIGNYLYALSYESLSSNELNNLGRTKSSRKAYLYKTKLSLQVPEWHMADNNEIFDHYYNRSGAIEFLPQATELFMFKENSRHFIVIFTNHNLKYNGSLKQLSEIVILQEHSPRNDGSIYFEHTNVVFFSHLIKIDEANENKFIDSNGNKYVVNVKYRHKINFRAYNEKGQQIAFHEQH